MMTCEAIKSYAATGRILLDDDGRVIANLSSHEADTAKLNAAGQRLWSMAEQMSRSMGWPVLECYEQVKQTPEGKVLLREHALNGNVMARLNANAGRRISVIVTDEVCEDDHVGHPALSDRPDIEIDRRARAHMDNSGEASYPTAVSHVLNADPELRRAYAKFIGTRR